MNLDPEMQEIFEGFLIETQELLDSLTNDLMEIESNPENEELINKIFRSFHTIKGTSSFMNVGKISHITHNAEDLLNKIRRKELPITQETIDVLLEVQDWIQLMLNELREGEDIIAEYGETLSKLEILKNGGTLGDIQIADSTQRTTASTASNIVKKETSNEEIGPAWSDTEDLSIEQTQEINALEKVLTDISITSHPGDFTPDEYSLLDQAFAELNKSFGQEFKPGTDEQAIIKENDIQVKEIENSETLEEIKPVDASIENSQTNQANQKSVPLPATTIQASPTTPSKDKAPGNAAISTDTIRIDVSRVESLMDLSGELVLSRNRLMQISENLDGKVDNKDIIRDLIDSTAQLDFITSEIQTAVMRMRMVPIAKLFQKAPRIVRDISKEFGKKIKLVLQGEETEIDRGIIEELNDPLVHMIRNSCDHGVEPPAERIAKGKPEEGTVILDASQEGNNIVLKIIDDGAGMDPQKLINKALEKGIITQEEARIYTPKEAFQLIFAPGFSTAKVVTSVSGRGVGMDVVRTNIQSLKGMIDIDSEINKGTTFTIKLPLTLAIIQGLLVRIQNETYAIPLSSVIEVVSTSNCEISTINKKEVIRIRNDVFPLIRIDYALKHPNPTAELTNRYVVIVGLGSEKYGLVCDELLGQQEIVIKSLGEYLGNIKGIAGSTILGDGRVIMIIDIGDFIAKLTDNKPKFVMLSA